MFVANIFERRLNANMRRHALDAKIAPLKPKPNCRAPIERRSARAEVPASCESGDAQLLSSFLASAVCTLPTNSTQQTSISQSASSASIETINEPIESPIALVAPSAKQLVYITSVEAEKCDAPLLVTLDCAGNVNGGCEKQHVDATALKMKTTIKNAAASSPFGRAGSMESVVFTDSDIDATSNVSFVA